MTKKTATLVVFCFSFLLWVGASIAESAKPNIVFIMADDLGWMDLASQGSGYYESPNIDPLPKPAYGSSAFTLPHPFARRPGER